ncbi:hypothetical protein QCA50_009122 [Cerrena zonata]|uniref:Uncharacterized protein n=1 Tax=Cerrena zonata TaxID=2478898 RepID=A0AAW0GD69_9APHY
MHDMVTERQINTLELASFNDYDYDYDLYYFSPSHSPYIVSPEDYEAFNRFEGLSFNRWALLHDTIPERSISPVLSFSYTSDSVPDFDFPEIEDNHANYGHLFRVGVQNALYRLSHSLDTFLNVVQNTLRVAWRNLRFWA